MGLIWLRFYPCFPSRYGRFANVGNTSELRPRRPVPEETNHAPPMGTGEALAASVAYNL